MIMNEQIYSQNVHRKARYASIVYEIKIRSSRSFGELNLFFKFFVKFLNFIRDFGPSGVSFF